MVDHQQAFIVLAVDGKKVHAVVVVAHLQRLGLRRRPKLPIALEAEGAPSSSGVPQGAAVAV